MYQAVRDLAAELTRLGCDIVTGGGPGLMQAANEGARIADPEGRQRSVGIRVELPFQQEVNAFVDEAHEHGTFFTRLHHFALVSDAFVVVPGGIGAVLDSALRRGRRRDPPDHPRAPCTLEESPAGRGLTPTSAGACAASRSS